jgi:hypothetical protein
MVFFAIGTWFGEGVKVISNGSKNLESKIERYNLIIQNITQEICVLTYTDETGTEKNYLGYSVENNIIRAEAEDGFGNLTLRYEPERDILYGGISTSKKVCDKTQNSVIAVPFFRQQIYS